MDAAGRVRAAMAAQPRERFLPTSERRRASYDGPLAIGHGQTNSQPRTVQAMLELLDVRPGQRVLDVGSGSGWTTALLAELVGPTGSVLGLERVPDLVVTGRANVEAAGMPWARVRSAVSGVLGAPELAPFDRVLVSAMATRLPLELVEQLQAHGILVAPVAGRMLRVERDPDAPDGRRVTEHGHYRFVPLVTD
jgi:protein-L-isoaspartate(D-aspartate) O-methyltransferase